MKSLKKEVKDFCLEVYDEWQKDKLLAVLFAFAFVAIASTIIFCICIGVFVLVTAILGMTTTAALIVFGFVSIIILSCSAIILFGRHLTILKRFEE